MTSTAIKLSPQDKLRMLKYALYAADAEVKAAEFLGEQEQTERAQIALEKFAEDVALLFSEQVAAETLSPNQRDVQYLRNVANAAVAFANLLESSTDSFYNLQKTGTYLELQEAMSAVIDDELVVVPPRSAAAAMATCKPREYTTPYGHKLSKLAELALTLANAVEDTRGKTSTTITINSPEVTVSGTDIHIDAYSTRAAQ